MPDKEKTINSALFIIERLGGRTDLHKLFKVLYFADQKHLAKFGTPISGDFYIAMKDGPVPSRLYDILKFLRDGAAWFVIEPDCHETFEFQGNHYVVGKKQPDLDELSESNIQCLLESVNENRDLTFGALREKSHKSAWDAAQNDEMSAIEIAREGGANEEMLKYIKLNIENQAFFNNHAIF